MNYKMFNFNSRFFPEFDFGRIGPHVSHTSDSYNGAQVILYDNFLLSKEMTLAYRDAKFTVL